VQAQGYKKMSSGHPRQVFFSFWESNISFSLQASLLQLQEQNKTCPGEALWRATCKPQLKFFSSLQKHAILIPV